MADKPLLTDTASAAKVKKLYLIDLNGATDITELPSLPSLGITAVSKVLFLDIVAQLSAAGIDKHLIPSKIEGVAFGQDLMVQGELKHTLYVANDNDFLATIADLLKLPSDPTRSLSLNPNQFYVFAFSDSELPGYTPQQFQAMNSNGR